MYTIFDILKEAEGDDQQNNTEDTSSTEDNNSVDVSDDAGNDDTEEISDDEFDIDATLDDPDAAGEEDSSSPEDSSTSDTSSSSDTSSTDGGDEEPNEDNTDIFSSLTAEEQSIKIKELKSQFRELYMSCDKLLERLNNIDVDDDDYHIINRFSNTLYDLKIYIGDYITNVFSTKSFVENDIAFNRFLMVIDSMNGILEKYNKSKEKK